HHMRIEIIETRLLPSNALRHVERCDLVLEGADNFATKFLAADAAHLCGKAIAQAGAVRWDGWALLGAPDAACLRCMFEDIPSDRVDSCASAGVVGPVVGVIAALQSALALRWLNAETADCNFYHYAGRSGTLRARQLQRRPDCALCSGKLTTIEPANY